MVPQLNGMNYEKMRRDQSTHIRGEEAMITTCESLGQHDNQVFVISKDSKRIGHKRKQSKKSIKYQKEGRVEVFLQQQSIGNMEQTKQK